MSTVDSKIVASQSSRFESSRSSRTYSSSVGDTPGYRVPSGRCITRLTREGTNFVFLMFFVFIGAILRDVNLLVALGGFLLGMLLLQWRFCSRTLVGLVVYRSLPKRALARLPFFVELRIQNPRAWLGAWLLVIEDRIGLQSLGFRHLPVQSSSFFERTNPAQLLDADRRDISPKNVQCISLVADHVFPGDSTHIAYECVCQRRGVYEFGSIDLSTRFPLSLMRGLCNLPLMQQLIVQPAIGELLPAWRDLFDNHKFGTRKQRSRVGVGEGEFYGLRAYRHGDSPRWIHWRTTAKRNELAVKQFERQELHQACILLDLFRPDPTRRSADQQAADDAAIETAIEFTATLVNVLIGKCHGSASIAVAGREIIVGRRIQSRPQLAELLDQFAVVDAWHENELRCAVDAMTRELTLVPRLIVVSTQPANWPPVKSVADRDISSTILERVHVQWLNVTAGDLNRYFRRAGA